MSELSLGFIGFGEAASHIAAGLHGAGLSRLSAYDARAGSTEAGPLIARRAAEAGVHLTASIAALTSEARIVVSAVTANVAVAVARQAAPTLGASHLYVDINSTSPDVKREVDAIVSAAGAEFVEAAVMAAVPGNGHRVPMLLCGRAAPALAAQLSPYGMRFEILGEAIGGAAAVKMFRSIMIKGIESLILECLVAAHEYGAADRVLGSLAESFPAVDWAGLAHYLMGRSAVHAERRAHEMDEVCRTLEAMGLEPIMAGAAARRLAWCAQFGLAARFAARPPDDFHEVLDAIAEARAR